MRLHFGYQMELQLPESLTETGRSASKIAQLHADDFVLIVDRKLHFLTM